MDEDEAHSDDMGLEHSRSPPATVALPGELVAGGSYPHGRKNVKQACEPCRRSKRKCDGRQPCVSCRRYDNECFYSDRPRRGYRGIRQTNPTREHRPSFSFEEQLTIARDAHEAMPTRSPPTFSSPKYHEVQATREGSEGSSTSRPQEPGRTTASPGVKAAEAGFKRTSSFQRIQPLVTYIVSEGEVERLYERYFEFVHPVLGFIESQQLYTMTRNRWIDVESICSYDAVICGVAALGSLFRGDSPYESALVDCARVHLERASFQGPPNLDHVAGWILRTLYLRITTKPHAAWIASCLTIHVIEATGADQDEFLALEDRAEHEAAEQSLECHRRQFWIAKMVNTWMSLECHRSMVDLRHATCKSPAFQPGDFTTELVSLYRLATVLDIDAATEPKELENFLWRVAQFIPHHDAIIVDRTHLVTCIYRRLRRLTADISQHCLESVISANLNGLRAAVRLAKVKLPWWHVADVPFKFICVLLAINTEQSRSHIPAAMEALVTVSHAFQTGSIQRAVQKAGWLIELGQIERGAHRSWDTSAMDAATRQSSIPVNAESSSANAQGSDSGINVSDASDYNRSFHDVDWDELLSSNVNLFN